MATIEDVSGPCSTAQLLRRQGVSYEALMDCLGFDRCQDNETIEEIEIQIKYSGYIKRQLQQIDRFKQLEARTIPAWFSYDAVMGFSNEVREKLKRVRPASIGQAARISGVTPAAISVLLVALEKDRRKSPLDERAAPHESVTNPAFP
jgi:tRNA uridine 5-carboxymethylaminomethyl modification enzyme